MIDKWIPILGGWHRAMRLNYPKFWHLQTVYVATFSVLASVTVAILAVFIPEQPDNITPIQPGFLLVLAACIAVTAIWIRNLLRPLTWKQISNAAAAPGLTVAAFHGAALLMPAFVYGSILECRMARSVLVDDVSTKLAMLESYRDAATDLNFAALLGTKKDISPNEWDEIWKSVENKNQNPIERLRGHTASNLVPLLSKKQYIIYYHYYDAYESISELDHIAKLLEGLDLKDGGEGNTKDKAWECMLWHGLLAAIQQPYMDLAQRDVESPELRPFFDGLRIEDAIKNLNLKSDFQDDLLKITQTQSAKIKGEKNNPWEKLDASTIYFVATKARPLLNVGGKLDCNKAVISDSSEPVISKWDGTINMPNEMVSNYVQFIKKTLMMHGNNRYLSLTSSPLKGWPLDKSDISNKSSLMKADKKVIDRAISNLKTVKYAFHGNYGYETFPWFNNWYWFGGKWPPFISLFILFILLIGCMVAREVEAEEMAVASVICVSIIGLYGVLLSAFGVDDLFYLIVQCGFVGLFSLMFGALIVAVYSPRIGVWWRWIAAATGLVLPFITLSVMAFLTRGCKGFACGSQHDIRLPIWAAGCVVLLVVGEAYLFLLRRAVIKPR